MESNIRRFDAARNRRVADRKQINETRVNARCGLGLLPPDEIYTTIERGNRHNFFLTPTRYLAFCHVG